MVAPAPEPTTMGTVYRTCHQVLVYGMEVRFTASRSMVELAKRDTGANWGAGTTVTLSMVHSP